MFSSRYENGVDAKGRVSIPAQFRAALGATQVCLYPAVGGGYLEGASQAYVEARAQAYAELDISQEDYDLLLTAFLSEVRFLPIDATGRIILPSDLAEYAGLTGKAQFVGLGDRFQIWSPERLAGRLDAARARSAEILARTPIRMKPSFDTKGRAG